MFTECHLSARLYSKHVPNSYSGMLKVGSFQNKQN